MVTKAQTTICVLGPPVVDMPYLKQLGGATITSTLSIRQTHGSCAVATQMLTPLVRECSTQVSVMVARLVVIVFEWGWLRYRLCSGGREGSLVNMPTVTKPSLYCSIIIL